MIIINASNRFENKTRQLRLHLTEGVAEIDFLSHDVIKIARGSD